MGSRKETAMGPESVSSGRSRVPHLERGMPPRKQPELASLARNLANPRWAERARFASEARVAQTAVDAIVTIDQLGEILFISTSAERLFGYPTPDVLGRSLNLLVPG